MDKRRRHLFLILAALMIIKHATVVFLAFQHIIMHEQN